VKRVAVLALLLASSLSLAESTETDSALWGGGLFLWETENTLDYSVEYQFRLGDHMESLSSQFVEGLGYYKANENLLFNGGYRFTRRSSREEHRLYFGGFLDLSKSRQGLALDVKEPRVTLQVGYQHDFDVKFDDEIMDSDSVRWILMASKPATENIRPFLLGGVLTTWNDAYSFGVDKIRLGGGVHFQLSKNSRVRAQYIWEQARFREPRKNTHILWLRYEMRFGS